jgi:MinD-like ATPase involved in chromosome partitioning or flagellar assembly
MTEYSKRVVFTMGGKGGVGKTGVVVALAEWFQANEIPVTLLDLDTENKARGSLKHFFDGSVTKVDVHTPAGLDAFVDHLDGGAPIILADMGAGAGQVASDWFDSMYEDVTATGVRFTAVGVVTPDPASVESVLAWANRLQDRVEYVVIENATSALADFTYWRSTKQANRFREAFTPAILQIEFRLAELENPLRQYGIQLGQVADRKTVVDELKRASLVMRAQSYRRRLFSEFDRARQVFLP